MGFGTPLTEEEQLLDHLRKVEVLYQRTANDGEQSAAASAIERIRARLAKLQSADPPKEYQFSMVDPWSRKLFTALLRRYGISPYRYRGQRRTTIMARIPKRFVDETLWPQYLELYRVLNAHLESVTDRIIASAIFEDTSDVETRAGAPLLSAAAVEA